eukprot:TRINITY_DN5452_c0_g1_i1.p1 TRINITY_DN5452_c0_g1~~TRINITY_DN5452_c0_g1_i1.p1  ORF type:complete len:279 (+),score=18.61 TRINITY_DN5452_c0_g1_i1:750-1586(+)
MIVFIVSPYKLFTMRALLLFFSALIFFVPAYSQTCTLTDTLDSKTFISTFRRAFREQVSNTDRNLVRDAETLLANVQMEFVPNTGVDCLQRSRIERDFCSSCVRDIGWAVPRRRFAINRERARRRQRDFVQELREGVCKRDPCKRHAKQSPSPMPEPLTYVASPQGSYFPLSFIMAVVVELDSARIVYQASNDDPNSFQPSLSGIVLESSGAGMDQNFFNCVSAGLQNIGVIDRAASAIANECIDDWNIPCFEQSLILNVCPAISDCAVGGISITNIC